MENQIEQIEQTQWYIMTVIGGKEDSIIDAIKEKLRNYGYEKYVGTIRVFKHTIEEVEKFSKDSNKLPISIKNTKTTRWEVLSDGSYKRIKTKTINKFPGYVFINMVYDRDVWYAIRNTPGVLGFLGSSGKGVAPIPITIEEYLNVSEENKPTEQPKVESTESVKEGITETKTTEESKPVVEQPAPAPAIIYSTDAKVGNTVEILEGSFAGWSGDVVKLNNETGEAIVAIDFMGRIQQIDVPYSQFRVQK